MDWLCRLEDLEAVWPPVAARFGLRPIEHRNGTDRGDWWTYYTPDLARLAMEIYGADMELYENGASPAFHEPAGSNSYADAVPIGGNAIAPGSAPAGNERGASR